MIKKKESELREQLEKEIKKCNQYILEHPGNKLMIKYLLGRISILDEILGVDSSSKINMAFATCD